MAGLYPRALDCGIRPGEFWELSLLEVTDLMESYERRERARLKQSLLEKHFLARDIGQYIALVVQGSDQVEVLDIWDFFPELFREEKEAAKQARTEQQLALYKAQMERFAFRYNQKIGGGA